jgi:ribosome biogenesis GTPase / thiamine phosphate phosphatase
VNAEIIATFGRHLLLRASDGSVRKARPQGRALEIACGDRVECSETAGETLVTAVRPRDTVLRRSSLRARSELLAANLTQVAVVVAPRPEPDLFVIDRFLCAAECAGLRALIVHNKQELPERQALAHALAPYTALAYLSCGVSAAQAANDRTALDALRDALRGQTTILVGQSGVGKSSLTRLLTSDVAEIAIGALIKEEEGRHTTTTARLYDCDGGGRIVDSPGVRDFAPAIDDLDAHTLGFREVARLASQCRFHDCKHLQEPGCAVREAVQSGAVDARRYESYRRLRRLYDDLWKKRPESERAARRY